MTAEALDAAPDTPAGRPRGAGIRKSFSGVEVLHGVDFTLRRGEVHGLVGQNGAGKSTLVKIIDGAYSGDAGEIRVDGDSVVPAAAPGAFRTRGIAMVFQEFSLIPAMPVARTSSCRESRRAAWGSSTTARSGAVPGPRSPGSGSDIDPDRLVEQLPVGARQLVEIAKAISQEASILILDEPTASLAAARDRGPQPGRCAGSPPRASPSSTSRTTSTR